MSLLESSKSFKPFRYEWAYEAWKTQHEIHWMASEIPLADDIADWNTKLDADEKNLLTQIFRFFTQSDIDVNECYITQYMNVFKPIEVRMMLSGFANAEANHIDAYSHLISQLSMPDTFYDEFLAYNEMKDKHDYLTNFVIDKNSPTYKSDIMTTMAMYAGFTEGLQLFSSFAILLHFQRPEGGGRMRGMGQIIQWSIRDESLHVASLARLFKTFKEENPDGWSDDVDKKIHDACETTVKLEDAFIDLAFSVSKIAGLDSNEVKQYIRYVADMRLMQLGLKPIYGIKMNPFPWVEESTLPAHVNFFENKVTEYAKGTTTGTWNDTWS